MALSRDEMLGFLAQAYSSVNTNKLNGIRAELDFGQYVSNLGFAERSTPGGWIMRPNRVGSFGAARAVALFPLPVTSDGAPAPDTATISTGVRAIAPHLQGANIDTYLCAMASNGDWMATLVGRPTEEAPARIVDLLSERFIKRKTAYNFLRYKHDPASLGSFSDRDLSSLYAIESLRVQVATHYFAEASDIDTLLWGTSRVYPIEVKEKTRAEAPDIGPWFGLDVGPFAKLAFYAAWYQRFSSLFVVREIADVTSRSLVKWWVIDFDTIAKRASWVQRAGGKNMSGGASAVVRIPLDSFQAFDAEYLKTLP